ncbi:MAG: hypothetical protein EA417_01410 [Gammaproteobacteria bacterium]|nr:MAG: hypothetical protein EA417_01410 [Gammaproteobacteria bacterium]
MFRHCLSKPALVQASLTLWLLMSPAAAFSDFNVGEASRPAPLRMLEAGPENYRTAVSRLRPGDRLQLTPGQYRHGLRLHDLAGTAEHPIVISGPESGEPAVFLARSGANTVSLRDAAFLTIRHLTLDGQGLNVAGVVAEAPGAWTNDITLEHLRIRNHDGSQGNTGITTRAPAWNWVIRHNDIRDVGTGLYLGRPDGTGPFVHGLIEHNVIANTLGYNMQIKHQNVREPLPGMPTEPGETVIRYNVFSKAERSNSGARARPNLLVGHWPPEGAGAEDRYLIYGNLFHQNPYQRLFQGEGNVALYNNLFFNSHGDALLIWPHNDRPKDVHVLYNTVVARGFGIRIDAPDPAYEQLVAGNAVFAGNPLVLDGGVDNRSNHLDAFAAAGRLLTSVEPDLTRLDLFPRDQLLRRDAEEFRAPDFLHLDHDYNRWLRETAVWGAYASDHETNPGRRMEKR